MKVWGTKVEREVHFKKIVNKEAQRNDVEIHQDPGFLFLDDLHQELSNRNNSNSNNYNNNRSNNSYYSSSNNNNNNNNNPLKILHYLHQDGVVILAVTGSPHRITKPLHLNNHIVQLVLKDV
ncbi:unnamed protein product [Meganyctiphanes norvegica]|uniref:Uncharacterized protein n=1 Tax=Meganyctiphanes norvegica TaxID=48144 RepID=A0AAV2RLE1_MEGNR